MGNFPLLQSECSGFNLLTLPPSFVSFAMPQAIGAVLLGSPIHPTPIGGKCPSWFTLSSSWESRVLCGNELHSSPFSPSSLPLCIMPVVSSFENSLPLPMGPTLKNKGRRDGGKRKENSIVLSKGISEKLQVSLCRFWLLCVLLSNPASLRGCHFAFISADRPVVSHCSPSPASVSAELPGFSRPP